MMAGWLTKELHVALGSRVWAPPVWAVVLALSVILFFLPAGAVAAGSGNRKGHDDCAF